MSLARLPFVAPALLLLAAAAPTSALQPKQGQPKQGQATGIDVVFENLRGGRGVLRLCLSRNPAHYPDCSGDPQARQVNIPANCRGTFRFDNLQQGSYALTALHDENGNAKLDTFLGIPREGFAFSNNPRIGFGPPAYERVRFSIGATRALIRLQFKYIT
jgi:uncharacterized protein (DUF2141 family)